MKFNEALESIKTYEAGKPIELVVREYGIDKDSIVKLASNENPFGCSPKVKDAVRAIIDNMALYPDDSMVKLKTALSGKYEIQGNELIIGAGSDQVIEFAIHAKAHSGSKVLVNSVTFAMYEIYAKQVGAEIIRTASREHKMDEFYTLYCEHKPSIIFLCTPNNPTGDGLLAQEMVDFIAKVDSDTLVIVDGAYMEYARFKNPDYAVEPKDLIAKFDNVLFLGTFSKAYGLGGCEWATELHKRLSSKPFIKFARRLTLRHSLLKRHRLRWKMRLSFRSAFVIILTRWLDMKNLHALRGSM